MSESEMAESESKTVKHDLFEPVGGVKGNSNPIIFLHAMLCTKEVWTNIPQRVADETSRMVYAYDARCHGDNKDVGVFNFDALVEDLANFMTALKIEKTVLVGHSMGGKTAVITAMRNPERVEKVIIVDMYVAQISPILLERSIRFLQLWRDAVRSLPPNTPVENVTRESLSILYETLDPQERLESERQAYLRSNFIYTRLENGEYDVSYNVEELQNGLDRYWRNPGLLQIFHEGFLYEGPAYFLYGTESPYRVNEQEASIRQHFPNAQIIPFEGAPHHIFVHSPDQFVQVLVDIIN